jgi:hypothetical protein
METFEVGDLVLDKLNEGDTSYGLGVVVATEKEGLSDNKWLYAPVGQPLNHRPGKRYDVYFNKFERTITFHGDYLEKV